jgi:hypothetical protein
VLWSSISVLRKLEQLRLPGHVFPPHPALDRGGSESITSRRDAAPGNVCAVG